MVSIKAMEEKAAREARIARMECARKQAADLGVAAARDYRSQALRQHLEIRHEVAVRISVDRGATMDEISNSVRLAQQQRGVGMMAAQQFVVARAAVADAELSAWEAEHELESRRYHLALASQRNVQREMEEHKKSASERLVACRKAAPLRVCSTSRTKSAPRVDVPKISPALVHVQVHSSDAAESGIDQAEVHSLWQKENRDLANAKVKSLRMETQRRAAAVVMQRRHDELMMQQQQAREAELQKTLMEATLRRSSRPGQAEFQEEEARRAQRINHQAHLDFEKIFLEADGWEASSRPIHSRLHPEVERDDSAVFFAPVPDDALMRCLYALPCRKEGALKRSSPSESDSEDDAEISSESS